MLILNKCDLKEVNQFLCLLRHSVVRIVSLRLSGSISGNLQYSLILNKQDINNILTSFKRSTYKDGIHFGLKGLYVWFLSVPPCKDANVRFTTVPSLKALSDQVWIRLLDINVYNFQLWFSLKVTLRISILQENS